MYYFVSCHGITSLRTHAVNSHKANSCDIKQAYYFFLLNVCIVTFCMVADCHITLEYEKSVTAEPQITITV